MPRKQPVNIEARLQEVAKDVAKGAKRKDILAKYSKKFQVSPRTIDTYIAKAQEIAAEIASTRKKAVTDAVYEYEKEATKRNLLSRDEKREILASIARGEHRIRKTFSTKDGLEDIIVEPDHLDIMKAIDLDAKMEGDFAAEKRELSGKIGFEEYLDASTDD